MAFATRLTPAMAARWRGTGLWSDETFATVLARWVQRDARSRGAHRWNAPAQLSRARARHRSHGGTVARARHRGRGRGDDPAAELGRVCIGVLRPRAPGRGGGHGQRRFPQPRARIHHALRRQQNAGLLRRRFATSITPPWRRSSSRGCPRSLSSASFAAPRARAWSVSTTSPRRAASRRASCRSPWMPTR